MQTETGERGKDDGMNGWRTVAVREKSSLKVRDNQLQIETDMKTTSVPLEQLGRLMLDAGGVSIPASALSALAEEHIHIMLCGDRHVPSCEVIPIGQHHEAAGSVMDQAEWKTENKDNVWKSIVELKLRNQERLLQYTGRFPPPQFAGYCRSVEPGDKTNREAVAARMYFQSLFGSDFRRHGPDALNSKLNYGYAILCSVFSRILAAHGYHTGLGIHHCSRDNPVNLSCDLMEAFRPVVDHMALENRDKELDWDLKKMFISLPGRKCWLEGRSSSLEEAAERFTLETLAAVKKGTDQLPEVRFV